MDQTRLLSAWNIAVSHLSKPDVKLDELQSDERMAAVLSSGQLCYFVVDYHERRISHINHTIKCVLGLDPHSMSFDKIAELIHPDDQSFVRQAEIAISDYYLHNIPRELIGKYKASYCLRMRTTSGNYQLFQHQSMVLSTDENGNCHQALNILTNISNLTSSNNYRVTLLDIKSNNCYIELDIYAQQRRFTQLLIFTKRETEIIKLMSQGLKSPEIAAKLFLSLHTVKNHRKNILQKAQLHSSSELIARCLHQGLI